MTPDKLDPVSYESWKRICRNYGLDEKQTEEVIAEAYRKQLWGHAFTTLMQKKKDGN
jgi:hypothetical protein